MISHLMFDFRCLNKINTNYDGDEMMRDGRVNINVRTSFNQGGHVQKKGRVVGWGGGGRGLLGITFGSCAPSDIYIFLTDAQSGGQ